MDIENLTLNQLSKIAALFNGGVAPVAPPTNDKPTHPFFGKYVVARCYSAGVHAGTVVSVDGENVILKDSRRLWSWKANDEDAVALSGVAQSGLQAGCKVDIVNPEILLTGLCELIVCSIKAKANIHGYKK